MNKKALLFSFFSLVFLFTAYSQPVNNEIGDVVLPTPNAGALMKYGDVPVSYFTGVPNISIPIHTLQEGGLTVPVSISYHASGIKLSEASSWVGNSWSLQAGGQISRSIQNIADESGNNDGKGYYENAVQNLSDLQNTTTGRDEASQGIIDSEPDIYNFSYPGGSGRFTLDVNGNPQLVPKQNLQIEIDYSNSIFHRFTIIDDNGTKYHFGRSPGGSENAYEYNYEGINVESLYPSSWYLVKMESHDGLSDIIFTYADEDYSYYQSASCQFVAVAQSCGTGTGGGNGNGAVCSGTGSLIIRNQNTYDYLLMNVNGKRIQSIQSNTETLTFETGALREDIGVNTANGGVAARSLDGIELNTGDYCKRFNFFYDYFADEELTDSYAKRLKLDSLKEETCTGASPLITIPPHVFTYNGPVYDNVGHANHGRQILPHRLSKAIDHWGYSNHAVSNQIKRLNIPNTEVYRPEGNITYNGGANRSTNEVALQEGMLTKITYPTGGSSSFEFEAHAYDSQNPILDTVAMPVTNCASFGTQACCSTTTASLTHTFTADDLANGSIFLELFHNDPYGNQTHDNSPLMCESLTDDAFLSLTIKETGGGSVGNATEFNFNSYTPDNVIIGKEMLVKISEDYSQLQAGVSYTLTITTINGKGVLYVQKPSTSTIPQIVGGLRIKKITTHDGISTDNDQIRTYEYLLENGNSSGQLQGYPQYGYQGQSLTQSYTIIKDNSISPLQGFQGFPIAYERVTEYEHHNGVVNGNGKTVYEFYINKTNYPALGGIDTLKVYPIPPSEYDPDNGESKNSISFNSSDQSLSANYTVPLAFVQPINGIPVKVLRVAQAANCDPTNWYASAPDYSTGLVYKSYVILTGVYLPKSVLTVKDEVEISTIYDYDDLTNHLYPTVITTDNSTGEQYVTTNRYVFEEAALQPNSVYSMMVDRNLISIPIKVEQKVIRDEVETQTGGVELKMATFDKTTGQKVACCNNSDPRLDSLFNYEISWDEGGAVLYSADDTNQDHWVFNKLHAKYDPLTGNPEKVVLTHWDTLYYSWDAQNKQLINQRFKDHEKQIRYYPNTSLLSAITQIDGQIDSIGYDGLIRPNLIWRRLGKVQTKFEYGYQYNGENLNFFKATTDFAAELFSDLRTVEIIDYQDGLNRSIQQVQRKHSPDTSPKDIITHQRYDDRGRPSQQYEPFKSSHDTGQYAADTTGIPYTLMEYEHSPLNRITKQTPPNWHPTLFEYGANTGVDAVTDYVNNNTFTAGVLFKTTQIDGNSNRQITFADTRGKTLLSRRSDGQTEENDTYTLYDIKERQAAIYPPDANSFTPNLIYEYFYDAGDNLISKKVPDAAKTNYVYNQRDLAIGTQSGNLLADGKWMVTEYDDFGRIITTGLNSSPTIVNEVWTKTFWDGQAAANFTGFSPFEIPKELEGILEPEAAAAAPSNQSSNPIYKGKVHYTETATLTGNIVSNDRLFSINEYDTYGRVSRVQTDNHLGGINDIFLFYDFADNLTDEIISHKHKDNSSNKSFQTTMKYDHQGRLENSLHKITGVPQQHLSELVYNEKDQLLTKYLGGTVSNYLQKVDYDYLDNRFLKGINSVMSADDLFQLNINYDQEVIGLSGAGQKNGNITSLGWQVKGEAAQTYGYTYDYLDRLRVANYDSPMNDYGTKYEYDDRGNITKIIRKGNYNDGNSFQPQQIDSLSFTPIAGTNKVQTITDKAPCPDNKVIHQALDNTEMHAVGETILADNLVNETGIITYQAGTSVTLMAGFHAKGGTDFTAKIGGCGTSGYETDGFVQRSADNYNYDNEGNQTEDPNKGIVTAYNYFNLPYKVTYNNGNTIEWKYDAAGQKIQKLVKRNGVTLPILTLDYVGGIEYENDTLAAIYLEESKAVFKSGNFEEYQFQLKDHLENNRVVFKDDGSGNAEVVQQEHFYPYGLSMKGAWQESNLATIHKYKFNGFERTIDFNLGIDIAPFRSYDPTTIRWWQADPKSEVFASWTPYKFGMNNPILYNDPNGDCEVCKDFIGASVAYASGIGNSIASNLVGGAPGTRNNPNDFGAYADYAAAGQTAGDVLSVAVGAAEQALGAIATVAGVAAAPETGGLSLGISVAGTAVAAHGAVVTSSALNNLLNDNGVVEANDKSPSDYFKEREGASPALDDNSFSPREVSKRQSQTRRDLGVEPDPDVAIPDQSPGRNIKQGVHTSEGKNRHSTGERNVASGEEHSRVAKGNRSGTRRN